MILLNPFGGAGAARRNWATVEHLFQKAHIDFTLLTTQYANHAQEVVRDQISPTDYDVICTVSGDGLVHEVINGLLNRPDWSSPVEIEGIGMTTFRDSVTLGAIPGGTGNGLVKSLLNRGGENYGVTEAAFRIIKGRSVKCDLTELTLEYYKKKVYSFLSFAWSVMADIDINSEAIRCCGPPRFTVWGVWRTLFMRDYWGSMRFIGSRSTQRMVEEKRQRDATTFSSQIGLLATQSDNGTHGTQGDLEE